MPSISTGAADLPLEKTVRAVFWVSGPPASGKTTLCRALVERFPKGLHLPIDDVREWVVSGMADSVPWTDETERQFRIAEEAACGIARTYFAHGFTVAVDHCRNMGRLETVIRDGLPEVPVVKICLMPDLDENLRRSHTRTNKTFDPHLLDETIHWTNARYRNDVPPGWTVIDNTQLSVDGTINQVLSRLPDFA